MDVYCYDKGIDIFSVKLYDGYLLPSASEERSYKLNYPAAKYILSFWLMSVGHILGLYCWKYMITSDAS